MNLSKRLRALRIRTRPQPLWAGIVEVFVGIAVLTGASTALLGGSLGYPTPETMRSIATVGAALLLGYIVEAVWLVQRARRESHHEYWLGTVCGLGLGGMLGIAVALATAADLEAGSGGFADRLGLWWSVYSISFLAILVTLQPLVVDRAMRGERGRSAD